MNMHNPPHPGEVLNEAHLKALRLSLTETAKTIGISRKHLSNIVNANVPVTADIAKRLEVLTGSSAQMWLNMQAGYDLWQLRDKDYSFIERVA